ncbi:MAG: hypothetical protein LBS05_08225 [Tannerellaceae bacterium]|jgi:hypothetical protein|nr:hypothetical protein [Tannerellaceae bacterium]
MARKSWLPSGTEAIIQQVIKSFDWVSNNRATIGMAATTPLGIWLDDYETSYLNPLLVTYNRWHNKEERNPLIMQAMKTALEEFLPHYREFHTLIVGNPLISDEKLIAMGYPPRPTNSRTPAPVATTPPGFGVIPELDHRIRIDFYPFNGKSGHAKPAGQHGAEIKWDYVDVAEKNPNALTHSLFDTASPVTLAFDTKDASRSIYITLRWENTRGLKGPWSEISTAVIP